MSLGTRSSRVAVCAAVLLLAGLLAGPSTSAGVGPPEQGGPGYSGCDTTPAPLHLRSPYSAGIAEETLDGSSQAGNIPYTYLLHVPENLPRRPVPLLVAMHGMGGSGGQFASQTQWARFADEHKFIVAFPTGPRAWDFTEDSLDVVFIRDVVAQIRDERCVDGRRIWATGHSNGGFLTQRLACDASDLFAAGASSAAGDPTLPSFPVLGGGCRAGDNAGPGQESVALGFWHGDQDQLISYQNGRGSWQAWADRYGCQPVSEATIAYGTVEEQGQCSHPQVIERDQATPRPFRVQFRTYHDHLHGYPDGCGGQGAASQGSCEPDESSWPTIDTMNTEILEFLTRHPRAMPAPR